MLALDAVKTNVLTLFFSASITSSATATAAKREPTALPRLPLLGANRMHKGRRNVPWPQPLKAPKAQA